MKIAFAIILTLSLSDKIIQTENDKWFFLRQVKFDNAETCPNKQVNLMLHLPLDRKINLNSVANTKFKVDSTSGIYVLIGTDTAGAIGVGALCDLNTPYTAYQIEVVFRGNCEDCFKIENCYGKPFVPGGAVQQMLFTHRETTAKEDSSIEFEGLDLCQTPNYIYVLTRSVNADREKKQISDGQF